MLRFSDGMNIEVDCKPHVLRLPDGLYVAGNNMLEAVDNMAAARRVLAEELEAWEKAEAKRNKGER